MINKQALRQNILKQSELLAEKSRFGLFSHPISTAVGDNGPYKSIIHPKNEQGKPITEQRNIVTSPTKKGQIQSSYFGHLNSLASSPIKDDYIQPQKRLLLQKNKKFNQNRKPQNFIPASGPSILSTSTYQYAQVKQINLNPKRNRNPDGTVKTSPKSIYSNPQSKINDTYFKKPDYIIDSYQRKKQIELARNKKNRNSIISDSPFKPNSYIPQSFDNLRNVYGESPQLKKKTTAQTTFNIYKHESAWKCSSPTKEGLYGSFSPYPKYIESPPKQITRKVSQGKDKTPFINMSYSCHKNPTPSVTRNYLNLRKLPSIVLKS